MSFHAAAVQLKIAQPTVSLLVVRELERAVSFPLFLRDGGRTRLTTEGAALLPQAERMMALASSSSAARCAISCRTGCVSARRTVSASPACQSWLAHLHQHFPNIELSITIASSRILAEQLNERQLDAALLVDPQLETHLRVVPLGVLPHAWAASPNLRLPRRKLMPGDLVNHAVLTNPESSHLAVMVRA
jgi:DNA-binding transcriptional LysR family regulator